MMESMWLETHLRKESIYNKTYLTAIYPTMLMHVLLSLQRVSFF